MQNSDPGLVINCRSGPVNTNLGPGPVNTNWGPWPVNTKLRTRAGKYNLVARAGGQAKGWRPGNTNSLLEVRMQAFIEELLR